MPQKNILKTQKLRKQKSPYLFIFISLMITVAIVSGFIIFKNKAENIAYKDIKIGSETFKLEVADTEATREKGLGYRDNLAMDKGMLFDFKSNNDWRMWMANMRFGIDIAWLTKEGKVVHIKSDAQPGSYPEAYHAETPSWYAIEVPAKTFERLKVNEGDIIKIN